jgi:CDP-diacylglycerol--glycerol-3-phosphate 3-phosphatidyltransferase
MKLGIFELIKNDKHTFGLPNLLTVLRLAFLPFIMYYLTLGTKRGDGLSLGFISLSVLTDFFDGFLARKMNMRSQLGRMLDPLVDKISVDVALLFLAAYKGLPYWYVFLVIGRDLVIIFASFHVISKARIVTESNLLGKYTLFSFSLVIIAYILGIRPLIYVTLWISVLLIPASLSKYFLSYRELIRKEKATALKRKNAVLVE